MQIGVETSRAVDGKRIFIAQMDEVTRAVLQLILQDENEAHDFTTLDQALEKARDWPPNLLVLGLADVTANPSVLISIGAALPSARVLLVAEEGEDAAAKAFVGNGAHGVLNKPLAVEPVRRQVDAALGLLQAPVIQLLGVPA